MRTCLLCLVIVVASPAPGAPAAPSDARARAKQHFKDGQKAFTLERFDDAIREFTAGYEIVPLPLFLYNLGQAYRLKGSHKQALFYYQQYLGTGDAKGEERKIAEEMVTELEKVVEMDRKAQESPPAGTVDPLPSHTATPPGAAASVTAPKPVDAPRAPTRSPWYKSPLGWTLGVSGIASIGVGAGLLGYAATLDPNNATSVDMQQQILNDTRNYRIAGGVMSGVGSLALIGSIVTFVMVARASSRPPTVSFYGLLVPGGAFTGIGGTLP